MLPLVWCVRHCGEFRTFILGLALFLAGPANGDAREFARDLLSVQLGVIGLIATMLMQEVSTFGAGVFLTSVFGCGRP